MTSPQINGVYDGYTIAVFSSEHETERGGTLRKMTAIEVELESKMPIDGAIASGGMVKLVESIGLAEEFKPTYDFWNTEYIIRTEDKRVASDYFTQVRLKALVELMNKKNMWVIFIFRGNDTLLRIDTPDPYETVEKLEKTVKSLVEIARLLELEKGESVNLTSIKARRVSNAQVVDVDEEALSFIGLELEEDEAHMQPDVAADAGQNDIKNDDEPIKKDNADKTVITAAPVGNDAPKVKEQADKKAQKKKAPASKKAPGPKKTTAKKPAKTPANKKLSDKI